MSRRATRIASACVLIALGCTALAVGDAARPPAGPNDGISDAPGGFATTHILLRVRPDIAANRAARADHGGASLDGGEVDAQLRAWGVTTISDVLAAAPRHAALAEQVGVGRTLKLHVPAGSDTRAMAAAFATLPGVELAEIDGVGEIADTIPNDPSFGQLWGMRNTGQTGGFPGADVDAPKAWDIVTGDAAVIIAMIDTGVQADHPDLNGKVISGRNTYGDNDNTDDPHGHGTHTAGTAAAWGNNGVGVAGMSWGSQILAMRCTTDGGTYFESDLAEAIIWAADYGAPIMSMSLQSYTGSQTLQDAVNYAFGAGCVLIAANGNNHGNTIAFPAKWPNCMGIAATNAFDGWPSYSNYGPETDVAAPGDAIYSLNKLSGYSTRSGTSMATPHVSGLAALLLSLNPCLTNAEIETHLRASTEDIGATGFDEKFGYGRVNAFLAVSTVSSGLSGDLNCDCAVNGFDIEPFIQALMDPTGYAADYPDCDVMHADVNDDGSIDGFDIDAFVALF